MRPYRQFLSIANYPYNHSNNIHNWVSKEKIARKITRDFKFESKTFAKCCSAEIVGEAFNLTFGGKILTVFTGEINRDISFPEPIDRVYLFNIADLYVKTQNRKLYHVNFFEYEKALPSNFFQSIFTKPNSPTLVCDFSHQQDLDLVYVSQKALVFKKRSKICFYNRNEKLFKELNILDEIQAHFSNHIRTVFVTKTKAYWITNREMDELTTHLKQETHLVSYKNIFDTPNDQLVELQKFHFKEEQFLTCIGDLFFTLSDQRNEIIAKNFVEQKNKPKKFSIDIPKDVVPKINYCQQFLYLQYQDKSQKTTLAAIDFLDEKVIYKKEYPRTKVVILKDRIVLQRTKRQATITEYKFTETYIVS